MASKADAPLMTNLPSGKLTSGLIPTRSLVELKISTGICFMVPAELSM